MGDTGERLSTLSVQLERLAADADTVLRAIDPASLNRTMGNIESVTQTLAENRSAISTFLTDASATAKRLNESAGRLDALMASAQTTIGALDPKQLSATLGNVEKFSGTLASRSAEIDQSLKDVAELAATLRASSASASNIIANIDKVASTIGANDSNIDGLLKDSAALAKSLNETTTKLDKALDDVSKLTSAVDPARINGAVDDVKRFTETLGRNAEVSMQR